MTPIAELLTRARLIDEQDDVPIDVVPYRIAGGVASEDTDAGARSGPGNWVAGDLHTLCEIVVAHMGAASLQEFISEHLPEPAGARVLGCILHLTGAEDTARFWWQYAAGAGDSTASYSLYLQHLSRGETHEAAWWRQQTDIDTRPAHETVTYTLGSNAPVKDEVDTSTPAVLHLLTRLLEKSGRCRPDVVKLVMNYVPGAVDLGYVDDDSFELPPLRSDFPEHIRILLNTALHTASMVSAWSTPPGSAPPGCPTTRCAGPQGNPAGKAPSGHPPGNTRRLRTSLKSEGLHPCSSVPEFCPTPFTDDLKASSYPSRTTTPSSTPAWHSLFQPMSPGATPLCPRTRRSTRETRPASRHPAAPPAAAMDRGPAPYRRRASLPRRLLRHRHRRRQPRRCLDRAAHLTPRVDDPRRNRCPAG